MRTIIAGSRTILRMSVFEEALAECPIKPTTLLSGGAAGVDRLGEVWARWNNIPIERYPADWNKHGRVAGFLRNKIMAANAEALIAIWDGKSRGTEHMITEAIKKKLLVHVYYANKKEKE